LKDSCIGPVRAEAEGLLKRAETYSTARRRLAKRRLYSLACALLGA
jgi:hypothetical protein